MKTDVFAGSILARQSEGKLIRVGKTKTEIQETVDYIKENYKKLDKFYILGLNKAVDSSLKSQLEVAGYTKVTVIGGKSKCADLGYAILYVKTNNLTSYTIEALRNIKPEQIYLVGDSTQISDQVKHVLTKVIGIKNSKILRINLSEEIK